MVMFSGGIASSDCLQGSARCQSGSDPACHLRRLADELKSCRASAPACRGSSTYCEPTRARFILRFMKMTRSLFFLGAIATLASTNISVKAESKPETPKQLVTNEYQG